MKKYYKNIIFDLDGTLADTAPDIIGCLKKAFASVPHGNDIKIDRNIIGPQVSGMIKQLKPDLKDEEVEVLTKEFRNCYDSNDFNLTKLYTGTEETLKALHDKRLNLFVATNKPKLPTLKILKKLNIYRYFTQIITPDFLAPKKLSKPEMIQFLIKRQELSLVKTVYVGDHQSDVISAKKNKITSIIFSGGYGEGPKIKESGPDYIIKKMQDLLII